MRKAREQRVKRKKRKRETRKREDDDDDDNDNEAREEERQSRTKKKEEEQGQSVTSSPSSSSRSSSSSSFDQLFCLPLSLAKTIKGSEEEEKKKKKKAQPNPSKASGRAEDVLVLPKKTAQSRGFLRFLTAMLRRHAGRQRAWAEEEQASRTRDGRGAAEEKRGKMGSSLSLPRISPSLDPGRLD